MEKPIHVKPNFYSYCYESLKDIAKNHGYNLLIHGSMNRDLDLIAVAWVNDPSSEMTVIKEMHKYLCNTSYDTVDMYSWSMLSGDRSSYVISLNRSGPWNNYKDEQYYFDICFTPHN
jgi:hypothetical protein